MTEFEWDDLIDLIESGQVIPVIGQELMQSTVAGELRSLYREVGERVAKKLELNVAWRNFAELNDLVCTYLERPDTRPADLHRAVVRELKEVSSAWPLPPALRKLAEIPKLDLFVSLTPDSLMAKALNSARYAGQPLSQEIGLSIDQPTDEQPEDQAGRARGRPVVFSFFGRTSAAASFAMHDEDALEYLHRFISGDLVPPPWLMRELRGRSMLMILGVHVPDWLGRFVLRAATHERLLITARRYLVARESAPDARTLAEFLRRFGRQTRITVYDGDATQFVDELHRRCLERLPAAKSDGDGQAHEALAAMPPKAGAEVFLSYGRENLPAVKSLHTEITKLGVKVWFDEQELNPGDKWHQSILSAIRHDVRLFIPVLSTKTAERARDDEGYVFAEWREAAKRADRFAGRKFILPVVVDPQFSGTLPYRTLMSEFPAFEEASLGWAPNGLPDAKLLQALQDEIREMRRKEPQR